MSVVGGLLGWGFPSPPVASSGPLPAARRRPAPHVAVGRSLCGPGNGGGEEVAFPAWGLLGVAKEGLAPRVSEPPLPPGC